VAGHGGSIAFGGRFRRLFSLRERKMLILALCQPSSHRSDFRRKAASFHHAVTHAEGRLVTNPVKPGGLVLQVVKRVHRVASSVSDRPFSRRKSGTVSDAIVEVSETSMVVPWLATISLTTAS
jgi:hypothetical protein